MAGTIPPLSLIGVHGASTVNIGFTYMGTKHRIADEVAEIISTEADGPVLDLFAGISAVGRALVGEHPVWCNDIQQFAFNVTAALFTSTTGGRLNNDQIDLCMSFYSENFVALTTPLKKDLDAEAQALAENDESAFGEFCRGLVLKCQGESNKSLRSELRCTPTRFPYRLFTTTYAGGFLGLRQAIEFDSLRYAIDQLAATKRINTECHRWLVVALCHALFRVSNSTGHFAQYLTIKPNNGYRFMLTRRRSACEFWRTSINSLTPLGSPEWRSLNRAYCQEATSLLECLHQKDERPSVIYADPPYTRDQYSRYYHLLDTLILYDYPEILSKGQYRADRYSSRFSIKTNVHEAFNELVAAAAKLKSPIIISYPEKGLLPDARGFLTSLLQSHYPKSGIAAEISHHHSSLGASKGREKSPVTEILYFGTM